MIASKFTPAAGTAAALLLTAGVTAAQTSPYTLTGSGCAGESGTVAGFDIGPTSLGFPTVGGPGYGIQIFGAANAPVLLGIGTSSFPGLDLTSLGLPGCFLQTLPVTSVPAVLDGNGDLTIPAPAPGLPGVNVFLQAYVADLGPSTLGATTELLTYTTLPATSLSGGEIIITEFLRDPSTISDSNGEWFEVYNTTGADIDMEGWWFGDDDFDLHQINNGGAGVIVPAGDYAVFGPNADPAIAGLAFDYVFSDYFLSNSTSSFGDEILILGPSGFEVDRVDYDLPGGWPLLGGSSASLDPGSLDGVANDDPANWCLNSTDIYETVAGVNSGTPGAANPVCSDDPPAGEQGDVIVTEFMQNPAALGDGDGEYIEVYNTTGADIDLLNWVISDLGSDSHVIASSVIVPAGGYATLARSATPGFTPDYVYSGYSLANGDDEIILTDDGGQLQDEIFYDNGATFPDGNGASANFSASASLDATTNNDGTNWCEATTADAGFTSGDFGSPGVANETCP